MNEKERHWLIGLLGDYTRWAQEATDREDRADWLARAETVNNILRHFERMDKVA